MKTEAILFDAMGTLVELEPPWFALASTLGIEDTERVRKAMLAEMAYYRDHAQEASEAQSLARLRADCAAFVEREVGVPVSADTLMSAIRFRAFDDAAPALADLRQRGLRLVCVSNWDYALPEVLAGCGLAGLLDGVVTSAEAGASKPDPAIFAAGLELAGCEADAALYVGDSPREDIEGATTAGIWALMIDRKGGGDVASLAEIAAHLSS